MFMLIEKIQLFNFGPYYDNHEIVFKNRGSGIHLIRGGNGHGKTSIQRAILWCLYGEVKDRNGKIIRPTSLLNHNARDLKIFQFWSKVHFIHEGCDWHIIREVKSRKHQDSKYEEGMTVEIYKGGRILPDAEHEIQRLIPSEISRFYFFDGEMLRDYEQLLEGDGRTIALLKDSIERVLGVPYFKTARSDVNSIKKKYDKERNRVLRQLGGKSLQDLADLQQKLQDDLDDIDATIKTLEEQIEELRLQIREKKSELADMQEVQDLAIERMDIENSITLNETLKDNKVRERNALVENLYKNVLSPVARTLIEELKIKSTSLMDKYRTKLEAEAHKKTIQKSIEDCTCKYCGTELDKSKIEEFRNELLEIDIKIAELTEIPEPNLSFERSKTSLEKMIINLVPTESLNNINSDISNFDYELARLNTNLKEVESKLEGVNAEEPRKIEVEIRTKAGEEGRLNGLLESKTNEKLKLLEEKSKVDREISSIPQDKLSELNKLVEFAEKVESVFDVAISKFRDEQKTKVESTASEIFKEIRSKNEFDHLEINDQYGLSIITNQNIALNRGEWRSSGEEQLVALSLMGALNKCAQVEAPIFMDTPFGRLDVAHGKRVLKYLPKMSKQLVLLVTDREFRPGDETYLDGTIKTDLTLNYIDEKEGSSIFPTTLGETKL